MSRANCFLPSLLVAMTAPALVYGADLGMPGTDAQHLSSGIVQVAQAVTTEEWIDALKTPLKPEERGLVVVPGIEVRVQFAFGSAELTTASRETLDQLGIALASEQLSPFQFRINGHTDAVGEVPFNKTLSERRANAVEDYLTANFTIDPDRLISLGLGEEVLLNSVDPAASENRRVEILNIGPAG